MEIVLVVGLVLGGIAVLSKLTPDARLRRELRRAPRRAITDLVDGKPARVVGRASVFDQRTVTSPITGNHCLLYSIICEEFRPAGSSVEWRLAAEETRGVQFFVTDASGRAVIDPTHSKVALETVVIEPLPIYEPTQLELAFRARHKLLGANRQFRYTEAVVTAESVVAVLGTGTREPDPDAQPEDAYRGPQPMRLRMTGSRRVPLVISDGATTQD